MTGNADRVSGILSYLLILMGGFFGSALRYLADEIFTTMPGTLLVNFAGSVGMGLFMYASIYTGRFGRHSRMLIGTGFIGAFTTFSALAVIAIQQSPIFAAAYIFLNILLGLLGILAGRTAVVGWRHA